MKWSSNCDITDSAGAVAFGEAAIYLGTVTVSAAGNATYNISQIVSKASSGRGSSGTESKVEKNEEHHLLPRQFKNNLKEQN